MPRVIVCQFTSLDDLPKKSYKDPAAVLQAISKAGRFSVFEVTSSKVLAKTMDTLGAWGFYKTVGGEYPWCEIEITDAGREFLQAKTPSR